MPRRFLILLAAAVAAAPAAASRAADGAAAADGVRAALERLEAEGEPAMQGVVHELAGLGGAALEPLFDELVGAGPPGRTWSDPALVDRTIETALGLLDRDALLQLLVERGGGTDDVGVRLRALGLLGAYVGPQNLDDLVTVARGRSDAPVPAVLADAFREALLAVLEREPDAGRGLSFLWTTCSVELCREIARAVGQSGIPDGLDHLGAWLGTEDDLDGILLAQVARLAASGQAGEPSEELLRRTRAYLREEHEGLRKAAAVAIARLGDLDSLPGLIELLASDSGGTRDTGHWALRTLTGLSMGPAPSRWRAWHEQELAWKRERSEEAYVRLTSDRREEVFAAVAEIVDHPLFGRDSALELATLLEHDDPSLRILACQALGGLGERSAAAYLVDALEYDLDEVRPHAWRALQALTGLELEQDEDVWREALESPGTP